MKKLFFAAATAALLFAPGFVPAEAQTVSSGQVLFGITFFKNELIRIDPITGVGTLVMDIPTAESGYGLTTYKGKLYTFNPNTNTIDQLSTIDGRVLSSQSIGTSNLAGEGDLVISNAGRGFLASAFDSSGQPSHPLYSFNLTTGTSLLLGHTSVAIDGLALSPKIPQTLYALGQGEATNGADPATVDTYLYRVNQLTGALTTIGAVGVPQNSPIAGLTFATDGTLYGAIDDKLYKIDTATGAATIVDAATPDFSFNSVSGLAYAGGASVLANLSSRADVLTGDKILDSGFIITNEGVTPPVAGTTKMIVMRGLGPSLTVDGTAVAGTLADPTLTLYNANGAPIASNDDWKQNSVADQAVITNAGLAPANAKESVIVANLAVGNYTAVLRGANNGTGLGLEEIYDLNEGNGLKLGNLSARAEVSPGNDVLISGMIIEGSITNRSLIRGLGPSLAGKVADPLPDPLLTAYDADGNVVETNDSWMHSPQVADIQNSGLAPSDPKEAVIDRVFEPGAYTIVLMGVGSQTTGTAMIEAYDRNTNQ